MTRSELEDHISKDYGVKPEHPWERYPSYAVFRHSDCRKWFAVIMTVPKIKFGITEDGCIDVVNLKCAEELIDSYRSEDGIYPAYHMSKGHWLSVSLDGNVPCDTVKWLTQVSYRLTSAKGKGKAKNK